MNTAKDYLLKNKVLWTIGLAALILFSFITANAASVPKATLKVTRLDFANGYWNYRADYTLKNLYDGSLKVNGAIFVNNINQSGSSETGYALKPSKKYVFTFYSKSKGKGRILASKVVVASKAPAVSQVAHNPVYTPTPIITPTPTPPSGSTTITKNGFLLSGSLCSFDYSLMPQSENNARRLLNLCEVDVPILEARFGRGPSAPIYKIQFYSPAAGSQGTGGDAIAYAGTSGVFLSTESWGTEFPYDAKILAHELTHVIQSFKGYNSADYPGWLVEALADYGAYVAGYSNDLEKDCYHFSNDMQNQTHVYSCTYKFLKFVGSKYDPETPFKLHKALQSGTYTENLWVQYAGKTFNQLTSECSQDSNCGGLYHGGL